MLNSALLHSTLGQCEEISDCSYTGQTFLQKRNINNVSELEVLDETTRRLLTDFHKLENSPPSPAGVSVALGDGDFLTWNCDIWSHSERFELTLTFPPDYPLQPPTVKFLSAMFHPNIAPDGRLPLTNWSPAHDVTKILTDIQSLLSQPHLESAVNQEAAQLYREDRREYQRRVKLSDYRSEAVRLASFTDWPVPYIQPPDLARAGFYFLNEKDYCRY